MRGGIREGRKKKENKGMTVVDSVDDKKRSAGLEERVEC